MNSRRVLYSVFAVLGLLTIPSVVIRAATNWTVSGSQVWSDGQVLVKGSNSSTEGSIRISSSSGSWTSDNMILSMKSDHALIETWGGTKPLALQVASGKVGIGTKSPGSKLDVNGTINAGNGLIQKGGSDLAGMTSVRDLGLYSHTAGNYIRLVTNSGRIGFYTDGYGGTNERMAVEADGVVRIPGTLKAGEVQVKSNVWADYVFEDDYQLASLGDLRSYIEENNHLPNIPTSEDVKKKGISIAEISAKQMAKIEELTLYILQLDERVNKLENENNI